MLITIIKELAATAAQQWGTLAGKIDDNFAAIKSNVITALSISGTKLTITKGDDTTEEQTLPGTTVVQATGTSTENVMSQKAVTDEFQRGHFAINGWPESKIPIDYAIYKIEIAWLNDWISPIYYFSACKNLETVYISNNLYLIKTLQGIFAGCSKLKEIIFDGNLTNCNSLERAFENTAITEISLAGLSNCTSLNCAFLNTFHLTKITLSELPLCTDFGFAFQYCYALTDLTLPNLGQASGATSCSFANCTALGKTGILKILNNLYDRKTAGFTTFTLTFNGTTYTGDADLTAAIAAATAKGFTVTGITV